jgi:CubicO group peptidase (beta-lactamase class C family)
LSLKQPCKKRTSIDIFQKFTGDKFVIKDGNINYISAYSNVVIAPAIQLPVLLGLDVSGDNLADAMKRLGELPLLHQPGEKWMYGLNVDLLGYLVEIWSGQSLDNFIRQRIFEPLGMKDTYFKVPAEKANRLVNLYSEDSTGNLIKQSGRVNGLDVNFPLWKKTYFSGGVDLSSIVFDYAIFLQILLNGGVYNGHRLLIRNTVRMMTMNQIGNIDFGDNKLGLGFSIVTEKSSGAFPSQAGTFSWEALSPLLTGPPQKKT